MGPLTPALQAQYRATRTPRRPSLIRLPVSTARWRWLRDRAPELAPYLDAILVAHEFLTAAYADLDAAVDRLKLDRRDA